MPEPIDDAAYAGVEDLPIELPEPADPKAITPDVNTGGGNGQARVAGQ